MNVNFQTIQSTLKWIIDRLREPTTVISLGFALAYFHIPVTQVALQMGADGVRDILVGASMLLGVVMSEKGIIAAAPAPASVALDRTTALAN